MTDTEIVKQLYSLREMALELSKSTFTGATEAEVHLLADLNKILWETKAQALSEAIDIIVKYREWVNVLV